MSRASSWNKSPHFVAKNWNKILLEKIVSNKTKVTFKYETLKNPKYKDLYVVILVFIPASGDEVY